MRHARLPAEILLQIVDCDMATSPTYKRGLCWYLVSPSFHKDCYFRRLIHHRWSLLDMRNGIPHFRTHAAISGSVDIFKTVPNVWDGLDEHPLFDLLTCTESNIRPQQSMVETIGERAAYHAAVLEATEERGTFNDHINVMSPPFRHRSDAVVYLDCLRYNHSVNSQLQPGFLDLLLILCHENGPSFPIHKSSNPESSPAFTLLNMFLDKFPDKWCFPSDRLKSSWKLICGGPIHVSPCVLQRLWDHQSTALKVHPVNDLFYSFWNYLIENSIPFFFNTDIGVNDAAELTSTGPHLAKALDWLCTNQAIKDVAIACIMRCAIAKRRLDVIEYVLVTKKIFNQQQIDETLRLCRHHGMSEMLDRLQSRLSENEPEQPAIAA